MLQTLPSPHLRFTAKSPQLPCSSAPSSLPHRRGEGGLVLSPRPIPARSTEAPGARDAAQEAGP
eukprot:scaffold975_cov63-Phaeocystis_antarctica.AAC.2